MTRKTIAQCIVCILSASTGIHAVTIDWNSAGTDGDWNTSASWDGGALPTASDDVKIRVTTNITVSAAADANSITKGFNSTLTVDTGGVLTLVEDLHVGEHGSIADGTKTGTVQLNSGGQVVVRNARLGGWDTTGGTAFLNIAGGSFTVGSTLYVGLGGDATLNLSGGTLDLTAGGWHNLNVAGGTQYGGNGEVYITGGNLLTGGIKMNADATGIARIYLDGGILDVTIGWAGTAEGNYNDGRVEFRNNSKLVIGDGVLQWKGTGKLAAVDAHIQSGYITYGTSLMTNNYPDVIPDQSWTSADGAVTIHADNNQLRAGYTVVWAVSNDSDGDGYDDNVDEFPDDVNEWADADGDSVGDNADVHNGFNDAELTVYLTNNNYIVDDGTGGGLTEQDIIDLRVGSKLASIANDQATLQVVIEQSNDLSSWSTLQTEDVTVDAPAGTDKQFFRYRMQD